VGEKDEAISQEAVPARATAGGEPRQAVNFRPPRLQKRPSLRPKAADPNGRSPVAVGDGEQEEEDFFKGF
jgi:hypothetical protein